MFPVFEREWGRTTDQIYVLLFKKCSHVLNPEKYVY